MGNTFWRISRLPVNQDHPHIHGEYRRNLRWDNGNGGSPPHTWGILNSQSYDIHQVQDHPHIHGEYLFLAVKELTRRRITPTYMGNTKVTSLITQRPQDHPHIHGEYLSGSGGHQLLLGSPPHTWGIP